MLWYANDDDVDFSPAPGGSRPTQALNLLSPTLNGHQPGTRQILCAYAPTNTTVDDVVTRVRQLVQGPLAVHDVQSFDGLGWLKFGPGADAVYGRRKTATSMQRSLVKGLPPAMSLAHSGAGIPGVLGCLQMAEAVVEEMTA